MDTLNLYLQQRTEAEEEAGGSAQSLQLQKRTEAESMEKLKMDTLNLYLQQRAKPAAAEADGGGVDGEAEDGYAEPLPPAAQGGRGQRAEPAAAEADGGGVDGEAEDGHAEPVPPAARKACSCRSGRRRSRWRS